jgi:hypothetical protein
MGSGSSDSGWRRLASFLVLLAGFGGYAFAFYRSLDLLDKLDLSEDFQKKVAIFYIVGLSGLIFALLVYRVVVSARKEKFANITPSMHSIVSGCKDLQSELLARQFDGEEPSKAEAEKLFKDGQRRLREICDGLARVFAMLTSTHCRAAIKVITQGSDGRLYVLTLARDNATHHRQPLLDKMRFERGIDPLEDNSEFMRLADDADPSYVFFSNDLSKERKFKCTSEAAYRMQTDRRRPLIERIRSDPWLLPYRSTITVAIRNSEETLAAGEPSVVGFLAVDSESRGVFNARWDPPLCSLIAEALFHPVNLLLALNPDDQPEDEVGAVQ